MERSDCTPLKLGGMRVLLMILALPALFFLWNKASSIGFSIGFKPPGVFMILALVWALWIALLTGFNLSWFGKYLDRNIHGYSEWYFMSSTNRLLSTIHYCRKPSGWSSGYIDADRCVMIEVPLGGWGSRHPKLWWHFTDIFNFARIQDWRARRSTTGNFGRQYVKLVDRDGQALNLSVEDALGHLGWLASNRHSRWTLSWGESIKELRKKANESRLAGDQNAA